MAYETNAGAVTVDPAIAYDSVSDEPIANVYETLVSFNGSSTVSFLPTLATCVPGTTPCVSDYGTGLVTTNGRGQPTTWTFVLDPAARFYDPAANVSWPVYPSDVMFSVARDLVYSDVPFAYATNGWILAQALLPNGSAGFDHALHFPYNTTASRILGSMLVNDSAYCPALARDGVHGNGCITFNATGGGQAWPEFLEFLAGNPGSSVVPCGWFSASAQAAGLPGVPGSRAPGGDGPCPLPGGAYNTSDPSFQAFLHDPATGANTSYWDALEQRAQTSSPAVDPHVQWSMVGSGPYRAAVRPGSGYNLSVNPAYRAPSGCGGNPSAFAQYPGGCDPGPGTYRPSVVVKWESNGATGLAALKSGTADFTSPYEPPLICLLVQCLPTYGLKVVPVPSLLEFQFNLAELWNATNYAKYGYPGAPNIPADFFTSVAARKFLAMSYPYLNLGPQLLNQGGLSSTIETGGPIPWGMGCYYPPSVASGCSNSYGVAFPNGMPDTNPADVGGAAWWWAEGRNASSPYYDPELAACTPGAPCVFPIGGVYGGLPANAVQEWILDIEAVSGGAAKPFLVSPTFCGFLSCPTQWGPGQNPLPVWMMGWAADYPDPTDVAAPYVYANGAFTGPDALAQQMALPRVTNSSCGHAAGSFGNLTFWANASNGTLAQACEGVAYQQAVWAFEQAGPLSPGPQRVLLYDLGETIVNGLAPYVWYGEPQSIVWAGMWINASSINHNPLFGGGGDQLWFQVEYVRPVSDVTFVESGLPRGTVWGLQVGALTNHTSTTKAVFQLPNGTFRYSALAPAGYQATPGTVAVTAPTPARVHVRFSPYDHYAATFAPGGVGLPPTENWSVTLRLIPHTGLLGPKPVTLHNANGSAIVWSDLANGSYAYRVHAAGFAVAAGAITIAGSSQVQVLSFTRVSYTVRVDEVGLANATWSVQVNGTAYDWTNVTVTGNSTELVIRDLPNGTYRVTIGAPPGWSVSRPVGGVLTIQVTGHSRAVVVAFRAT